MIKYNKKKLFIILGIVSLTIIFIITIPLIIFHPRKISYYINEDISSLVKIEVKVHNDDKQVYSIEENDKTLFMVNILQIKVKPLIEAVKGRTPKTFIIYFENNRYEINGFCLKNDLKNKYYYFEFIELPTLISDFINNYR